MRSEKQGTAFLKGGSSITLRTTSAGLIFPSLVDVSQEAGENFFQMDHHLTVFIQVAAKGIRDVTTTQSVIGDEFSDEINLVFRLWKVIQDRGHVVAAEGEDVRGGLHKINGHRLAAMAGKIHPALLRQGHAVLAGLLP